MPEDKVEVVQGDAYVKLYKNSKNFNWEVKLFQSTNTKDIEILIGEIERLNSIMLNKFDMEV